jgi:hypothetical protein
MTIQNNGQQGIIASLNSSVFLRAYTRDTREPHHDHE